MANIPSAIKKIRTDEKRTARNKAWRSRVKTLVKKTNELIAQENLSSKEIEEKFKEAQKHIDKAAKEKILHPNKAARLKSKLAKKISKTSAAHEAKKS